MPISFHISKLFMFMNTFDPQDNMIKQVLLSSSLYKLKKWRHREAKKLACK